VAHDWASEEGGHYQLLVDVTANERFIDGQFDYNKCRLVFKADGHELMRPEYTREGNKPFHYEFEQTWTAGNHALTFELEPLTPKQQQVRSLTLRIESVTIRGPLESKYWVRPKGYERFFPKPVPGSSTARRQYAREILEPFVQKAYRRPTERA